MKMLHRLLSVVVIFGVGAAIIGCSPSLVMFRESTSVLITEEGGQTAVREAIVRALPRANFNAEDEQEGQITARSIQGTVMLQVAINFSENQFEIVHLDSSGLGRTTNETGQTVINRRYDQYINNLSRNIQTELRRPAREAARAAARAAAVESESAEDARRDDRRARRSEAREQRRAEYRQLVREESERRAEFQEREAQRQHETELARIEAEASRPVIIGGQTAVVSGLAFDVNQTYTGQNVVQIASGFLPDPQVIQGVAGGPRNGATMGLPQGCRGHFSPSFSHVMVLDSGFGYLRLETLAGGDVTMAVVAPDGNVWCDDDGGQGLNSRIEGSFPPGTYQVYVGAYQAGRRVPYQLHFTEYRADGNTNAVQISPNSHAAMLENSVQPQSPPNCRAMVVEFGHSPVNTVHCDGAEPYCAAALIRAGHSPVNLVHCTGVEPDCAVGLLEAGRSPVHLAHCR